MWQTIYGGVLLCTRTHTHTHTHTTVSPDAIHEHVKTKQLEHKARLHYTAPEYAGNSTVLYICSHCACKHVHVHVHINVYYVHVQYMYKSCFFYQAMLLSALQLTSMLLVSVLWRYMYTCSIYCALNVCTFLSMYVHVHNTQHTFGTMYSIYCVTSIVDSITVCNTGYIV